MSAPTLKQIRELSDDELIARHNSIAQNTVVGLNYYLEEIARREQNKQTEAMLQYTRQLWILTFIVTAATLINLAVAVILLFR